MTPTMKTWIGLVVISCVAAFVAFVKLRSRLDEFRGTILGTCHTTVHLLTRERPSVDCAPGRDVAVVPTSEGIIVTCSCEEFSAPTPALPSPSPGSGYRL